MPGPAPNPNARRRNHKRPDFVLPRGGRKGRAPAFPIKESRVPSTWADLWRTPQAAAWDALGIERVVARYALLLLEAEKPAATGALLNEVRQLEDRLGLTPMAMRRLQWELSDDEVTEQRSADRKTSEGMTARAARLRIVG